MEVKAFFYVELMSESRNAL